MGTNLLLNTSDGCIHREVNAQKILNESAAPRMASVSSQRTHVSYPCAFTNTTSENWLSGSETAEEPPSTEEQYMQNTYVGFTLASAVKEVSGRGSAVTA